MLKNLQGFNVAIWPTPKFKLQLLTLLSVFFTASNCKHSEVQNDSKTKNAFSPSSSFKRLSDGTIVAPISFDGKIHTYLRKNGSDVPFQDRSQELKEHFSKVKAALDSTNTQKTARVRKYLSEKFVAEYIRGLYPQTWNFVGPHLASPSVEVLLSADGILGLKIPTKNFPSNPSTATALWNGMPQIKSLVIRQLGMESVTPDATLSSRVFPKLKHLTLTGYLTKFKSYSEGSFVQAIRSAIQMTSLRLDMCTPIVFQELSKVKDILSPNLEVLSISVAPDMIFDIAGANQRALEEAAKDYVVPKDLDYVSVREQQPDQESVALFFSSIKEVFPNLKVLTLEGDFFNNKNAMSYFEGALKNSIPNVKFVKSIKESREFQYSFAKELQWVEP